jgi:hypothetical protein
MTLSVVFLDSSPLDLLTRRQGIPEADACRLWMDGLAANGILVYIPEIADYEVRRGLYHAGYNTRIARLDALKQTRPLIYLPLSTPAMNVAAVLWANAQKQGVATAHKHALDGDVILAAQALTCGMPKGTYIVATDNQNHIARYVDADEWRHIQP